MRIEQKLAIPLFLISVGNLIKVLSKAYPLWYISIWVLPFLVIAIILAAIKIKINYRILSIFLLFLSFFSIAYSEKDSMEGIFYLFYSLYISTKNKRTYLIYGIMSSIAVMLRFYILNMGSSSTINYIAGGLFISLFYFHFIHPKPKSKTLYRNPDKVPYVVVDIMELRIKGFRNKEIPDKLGIKLTEAGVGQKLKRCRDDLGIASNEKLALYLDKNNYICLDNDKY